jgi:hypothetical protein
MRKLSIIACLITLGVLSCMFFAQKANADVPIVFDLPAGTDPDKVWVQFLGTNPLTGTYRDSSGHQLELKKNSPYSFAQITSPTPVSAAAPANKPAVLITEFVGGRIYVNFGNEGLQGLVGGYQPSLQNPTDPNIDKRWQNFEVTVEENKYNGNMTYIDCISISWSMEAKNAPTAKNPQLLTPADCQTLAEATAATPVAPDSNVVPLGKILPSPDFVRVLGTMQAPKKYHDWKNYLQTTLQGKTTRIAGVFVGLGDQPAADSLLQAQTFDFLVTFDTAGNAHMVAQTGSGNGQDISVPDIQRGTGIGNNVTITITYDELNGVNGIYGNNPKYTYTIDGIPTITTGIQNDVTGWIVGDLLAGCSFGFPGSTVIFDGKPIGDLYSAEWWGGENGRRPYQAYPSQIPKDETPGGHGLYFDKAQPAQPDNYDRWSNSLYPLTSAYGFSLEDRLGQTLMTVTLSENPDFYLLMTINSDDHGTSHTVTPSAGANGSISPNTAQQIKQGQTKEFTVTSDAGYTAAVAGTCGGKLVGTTYTTNAITADCTVNATFTAATQHTVNASAGANGSISPSTRVVNNGNKTSFTVTPDNGYGIDTVTGCGGTLSGNTYTTGAITADCTVSATFKALAAYTVTPSAGANGSISPGTAQTVHDSQTTQFTVTPDAGYTAAVAGTCGGRLVGTAYTTSAITADCTVNATFSTASTHTVTPSAGANGSISPSTAQTVYDGRTTAFTVTPNTGYTPTVAGTCGGSLVGTTYTTNAITSDCTVNATFSTGSYTVHGTAGNGGQIDPTARTVDYGGTTSFQITPGGAYSIEAVVGCGGTLSGGNIYTTGPITGGCNVVATFKASAPIPTLNEWGMIVLALFLVCSAIIVMRRRQRT